MMSDFQKARLQIRHTQYRGQDGYLLTGRDLFNRNVRVFTPDRDRAEKMRELYKQQTPENRQALDIRISNVLIGHADLEKKYLPQYSDNPTLVGWRQGVVEPKVDLREGDVFYTGDDPRIPNSGKPRETFTVLLRGPEKTAPQDIGMGLFVAEVDGRGVKYSANAKGRELRRTPPKRKIKRAAKPKTRRVYVPAIAGTKKGG